MKSIISVTSILLWIAAVSFSCSKKETPASETTTDATTQEATLPKVERKSADNLDSLTSILISCLKSKDKLKYASYCFTAEQEDALSNLIGDKKKKKYFQREFGFSLHEEVVYFENIVKYLDKTGIDLNKIENSIIESIDYNKSNYEPVELKEVIIPIMQEGIERDVVYVAVQIDGRWYFTSELSL